MARILLIATQLTQRTTQCRMARPWILSVNSKSHRRGYRSRSQDIIHAPAFDGYSIPLGQ